MGAFSKSILLIGLWVLVGCEQPTQPSNGIDFTISDCKSIATDQSGTFMARPAKYPVEVRLDSRFSPSEVRDIETAIEEWNAYGQANVGSNLFRVTTAVFSKELTEAEPRGCPTDTDGSVLPVVREDTNDRWNASNIGQAVQAITAKCFLDQEITAQKIVVNMARAHAEQLSSIVLHEVGHAVGLDHSCQLNSAKSSSTYRSCTTLSQFHPYVQAVMYPVLRVEGSLIEIKEKLRQNDINRALCILHR